MPTSELTGAGTGERVGGAGALPGSANETGVAVVPDERVGEQTPTLAGRISNARDTALSSPAAAAAYVSHGTNQVDETISKSAVRPYLYAYADHASSPWPPPRPLAARHNDRADAGDQGHPRERVDRRRRRAPWLAERDGRYCAARGVHARRLAHRHCDLESSTAGEM
jgi:hypothetical protein